MKNQKVKAIVQTALAAATLCVLSPLSIPMPGGVPVSLQVLILFLACYAVGTLQTLAAYGVYLLLGIVGIPVFSGFMGGVGRLAGPTGGYLIGFFLMIPICGVCIDRSRGRALPIIGMICGTAAAYTFGTAWFVIMQKTSVPAALAACVLPFIPFDLIKIAIAAIAGPQLKKRLRR